MRGSRDLCVTSLLLADGILSRTIYLLLIAIVFYERLGSRHNHKEIKLQEYMNGIDYILCKTDLNVIRRLAYTQRCACHVYTLNHFPSPPMYICGIHNFNNSVFRKGWFLFI